MNKLCIVCLMLFLANSHADVVCENAVKQGDYAQALTICENQLKNQPNDKINIWFYLFEIHLKLGHRVEESYYLEKIRNSDNFDKNIETQYRWNRNMGQKYYRQGDFEKAEVYLNQSLEIAINENNDDWLSLSYNDVGLAAYRLKKHALALTYYKQSLAIKLRQGDAYQIGKTYNNIALAHMGIEDLVLAIDYYEQALNQYLLYAQQNNDKRIYGSISHIYEDLTNAYVENGDTKKAKIYANKILNTFKLKKSPSAQARALINIAKYQLSIKEYTTAQLFYEDARSIYDENKLEYNVGFYLAGASVYYHNNQLDQAYEFIEIGLKLAESNKDINRKSQFYYLLSQFYQSTDIKKAFDNLKKYNHSREQFLQEKYDTDLNNVKHEIENQKINHDLTNEQLINVKKSAELQQLTNVILVTLMLLLILSVVLITYFINKKKERRALLDSIKHHEQQLFLMQHKNLTFKPESEHSTCGNLKHEFKLSLVSLLIDALSIWEKTTNTDRIELAEKSKVWTISIDNGTLRTRSLDKYLEIDKIPDNPRWRNVVKTCHFILTQDNLLIDDRRFMEKKLAALLKQVKQLSLVSVKG